MTDHVAAEVVRSARADDVPAIEAVVTAAYTGYLDRMGGLRPGPLDADYAQAVATSEVWVVELDGAVVAFLVLQPAEDHLLLDNVAVHPSFQGRGLGRRLLALAEERARARGLDLLRLYTHVTMVENQRWYERVGYVETGRRTDHGFARVFYEKRLA